MPIARDPLTPYFHPTTACFVDDNESFMAGLALVLPEHMNSFAFFDPTAALAYVNQPQEMPTLADRCFSAHSSAERQLFRLDTNLIEHEINIVRRFNRLSVVIVDYSMPTLNGLEFCEQVRDPHVGKVLLTGVADEKMAVEAFNAGIIDRFISKSHPLASEHISEYSRDMQHAYFRAQTEQMRKTLALAGPVFLDDEAVTDWVRRLLRRKNFCEYYMVSEPPGLLLVTPAGQLQQLVILSGAQCDAQADYAAAQGAPASVVARLRNHSHVGFFMEDPAAYTTDPTTGDAYPWQELLHRATTLGSREHPWYAALVGEPPPFIDYEPANASHDAWQELRKSNRPYKSSLLEP